MNPTQFSVGDLIKYIRPDGELNSKGSILRVTRVIIGRSFETEMKQPASLSSSLKPEWKNHEMWKFSLVTSLSKESDPILRKIAYLKDKFNNRKGVQHGCYF